MGYNYSKLLGKIKEVCGTHAEFGRRMGWSERTTSLKLNCSRDWKKAEIEKACGILSINIEKIPLYFFSPDVQY